MPCKEEEEETQGVTMNTNKFISKPEVSFWVPILVAVVSVATSFAVLSFRVSANERSIIKSEQRVDEAVRKAEVEFGENSKVLLEIQVKLAEIQKDLSWIKSKLDSN